MTGIAATAQILIHRPAAAVYEAFANPDVMTRFWFPKASGPLSEGALVYWYLGAEAGALAITVDVKEARPQEALRFAWGDGDSFTDVAFAFEARGNAATILRVTETGFAGSDAVQAALASTAGFNQVIVAAKALLEHDVALNIVRDHAE